MTSEHEQISEYHRSRQSERTLDSQVDYNGSTQHSPGDMLPRQPGLLRSAGIGASCNAPVRAEGMRQMQQTHGNRAVQRAIGTSGPAGRVSVQRYEWGNLESQEEAMRNASKALTGAEPMHTVGSVQPYGPTPTPMHTVGSVQHDGGWSAQDKDGGVSTAEDDSINEAIAMLDNGSEAPWLPPAPPQQDVPESFGQRFGNVGDVNNAVDVVTTAAPAMGEAAFLGKAPAALAHLSDLTPTGRAIGKLGTGSDILGVGMGIYNFATAKDNYERVQAGADTVASGVGLFGGPVGSAFSAGYGAGQLLNKGADWIGDWITGNEEGDHSLSGMLSDGMVSLFNGESEPMRLIREHQEKADARAFMTRRENRHRAQAEQQEKARFEKEMAGYEALARGEYQRPLQQPDPLTIRPQVPDQDDMPIVPMKLP